MSEKNYQELIEENKRLKLDVETYLKGYENILADKILLEEELKTLKLSSIQQNKEIKYFNPGKTTIFKAQLENFQYQSEIDEYLNTIFDLQTKLSQKEEEMRVLSEKNKSLEDQVQNLSKNSSKNINNEEKNEKKEIPMNKKSDEQNPILNMDDLYKSTILSQANKAVEQRVKNSININLEKKEEEEKEKKRLEIEEKKRKEEEEKRRKEEEEKRREEEEEKKKRIKELEEKKRQKELEELERKKKLEEEKQKKQLQESIKKFLKLKNDQEKQLEEITKKNNIFYKETESQFVFVDNYNTFINELNQEINSLKAQINISIVGTEMLNKQKAKNNKIIEFTNTLESISLKVKQFNEIINDSKNKKLKEAENLQTEIREKINEINTENNNVNDKNLSSFKNNLELYTNYISMKLNELEQILEVLNSNKSSYENSKKNIEQDINNLKKEIGAYVEKIKQAQSIMMKESINILGINKNENEPNLDSLFLKGSMLLEINDFGQKDVFSSTNVFSEEDFVKKGAQDLIRKNWNEICYVHEDYDIHDVNYELKAVGLPSNSFFTSCSMGFVIGADIEILQFEKDGKKEDYEYSDYSLEFKIYLKNNQSNRIHVKYKESPSKSKMTEGEKRERKFVRNDWYGLSKNLAGQRAKFVLCIKCGFEVISFDQEFFMKTNDKEYTWGGTVPPEGKRTLVKMSKSKGKYSFNHSQQIRSLTSLPIKSTKMTVPVSFVGGNNEIIKIDSSSNETTKITLNKEKGIYEIDFKDTNSQNCSFNITGQLINRCRGEWICELTDKQIEEKLPKDYTTNKKLFNDKAKQIIKEYDNAHKNSMIKVPDVVKIGKWVKKNVTYDLRYTGRNEIEATEILKNRIGVCHHFTKLFNALMYSLGYQVIYVSGYALNKKDHYDRSDAHAWSLVKIKGKWLPFDATWGIFSGKLPVCHVFKQYFPSTVQVIGTDSIEFGKGKDEGKFIG